MPTTWTDVIAGSAMTFINDQRMRDDLATNPALFYRTMKHWVDLGIGLMNKPPELSLLLTTNFTAPTWDDFAWDSTQQSTTQQTTVSTGKTGYDICSCVVIEAERSGDVYYTAYPYITYDPTTGDVVFPIQEKEGISYQLDFYKDGVFGADLTLRQKRLLGMAIAVTWDNRFNRDWMANTMKIHDKSFSTDKESSYMNSTTSKFLKNAEMFFQELNKYEQDCLYVNHVNPMRRIPNLL